MPAQASFSTREVALRREFHVNNPRCELCGRTMRKNGTTSSGRQRWRCSQCGSSSVRRINARAKRLETFLRRLLSKQTQSDMGCSRSTLKRMTKEFWEIWPIAPYSGEVRDAIFLDGIWIGRDAVVLMACTKEHVLAWHLAETECASAWAAPMTRMPAPAMAVTDGRRALRGRRGRHGPRPASNAAPSMPFAR